MTPMTTAPIGWAWFHFPLEGEGTEALDIENVVRLAHEALDRAAASGDREHLGPVLHWAHQLKTEQTEAGDWPAAVNARTGAALGAGRTRTPAGLMRRLEEILQSTEFSECIARADTRPERS